MSSFMGKCRNKKTGTEYAVFCHDDFFGSHAYGYHIQESDEPVMTEEQFHKHYEMIGEEVR
jgi:hypothetical protein